MAIIDEKGRLFGKINLLDLVIVLVILGVAGRFGYKWYAGKNAAVEGQDTTIALTFRLSGVTEPTIKELPVGALIFDSKSNAYLGKVTVADPKPSKVVSYTEDGRLLEAESKDLKDLYITIEGGGRVTENIVTVGGVEVKIGRAAGLRTARWAGMGVPVGIVPKSAQ